MIHIACNPEQRTEVEMGLFGRALRSDEYPAFGGYIRGEVRVRVDYDREWPEDGLLGVRITSEGEIGTVKVRIVPGRLELNYIEVKSPYWGKRLGTRMVKGIASAASVHNATAADPHKLNTISATGARYATQGPNSELSQWGYAELPRLGFDGEIPNWGPDLPQELRGFTGLIDLCQDEAGRRFWREHGVRVENLTFDLDPGSRSWQILNERVAQAGATGIEISGDSTPAAIPERESLPSSRPEEEAEEFVALLLRERSTPDRDIVDADSDRFLPPLSDLPGRQ